MQRFRFFTLFLACLIIGLVGAVTHASDPVAVYARVDRVVLAPDAQTPRTIQVFGVFSIATPNDPNFYQPVAPGYLYFTIPTDDPIVKREWNDLKEIAGTRQIVAFGSRFKMKARVRPSTEAPANPDTYTTAWGVTKVEGKTDYKPIRALLDFRQ